MANQYDFITNELTNLTDVDGSTALLLSDGSSWEFMDGEWQQTEQSTDEFIKATIYPFLMSVCDSIHNDFVRCCLSKVYKNVTLAYHEDCCVDKKSVVEINGLSEAPKVCKGDYVLLRTVANNYLTTVCGTTNNQIFVDNNGLNIRITGEPECVGVHFVSFPPQFLDAALSMLGYDIYSREDKEKRQERLGNYTYTNFEPIQYYGNGSYPQYLEDTVKYWQNICL